MINFLRGFFLLVFAILIIAFVIINRDDTVLHWSPVHEPLIVPLYLALTAALCIGIVFGILLLGMKYISLKMENHTLRKRLKSLEKQQDTNTEKTIQIIHAPESRNIP